MAEDASRNAPTLGNSGVLGAGDTATAVRRHWEVLADRLATGGPGEDGIRLGRARSAMLAELLGHLHAQAVETTGVREGVALAAVGTFGRGAVALRSDVDVRLVVRPGTKNREAAARLADALLYPLWDAGISVGHQVVDISEALELAQTDLATATSLLDLRLIAGDASLVTEIEEL